MDSLDTMARCECSIPMAGWMREGVLLGKSPQCQSGAGGGLERPAAAQQRSQRPVGMPCPPPSHSSQRGEAAKELIKGAAHYPRPPSDTAVLGNETL